jgi:predicted nucleotidyltransferase
MNVTLTKKSTWEQVRPKVTENHLQEIRDRVVEKFHPERLVLFGSYAYGTPHANSDIDLLIVMDSEESMARRIARVAPAVRIPFLPMDLLILTPSEVSERLLQGDTFLKEILSKGRTLYENPMVALNVG